MKTRVKNPHQSHCAFVFLLLFFCLARVSNFNSACFIIFCPSTCLQSCLLHCPHSTRLPPPADLYQRPSLGREKVSPYCQCLCDSETRVRTILIEFESLKVVHNLCPDWTELCFHSTSHGQGYIPNNIFQHQQRHCRRQQHFPQFLTYAINIFSHITRHLCTDMTSNHIVFEISQNMCFHKLLKASSTINHTYQKRKTTF